MHLSVDDSVISIFVLVIAKCVHQALYWITPSDSCKCEVFKWNSLLKLNIIICHVCNCSNYQFSANQTKYEFNFKISSNYAHKYSLSWVNIADAIDRNVAYNLKKKIVHQRKWSLTYIFCSNIKTSTLN